jgi:methyl-accepting chemotaxis protein
MRFRHSIAAKAVMTLGLSLGAFICEHIDQSTLGDFFQGGALGIGAYAFASIYRQVTGFLESTNAALLRISMGDVTCSAGDAGRGFAVVADEVRKLANHTLATTEEIGGGLVRAINDASKRTANSLDDATDAMQSNAAAARESESALNAATEGCEGVASASQGIALKLGQQVAVAQQVESKAEGLVEVSTEAAQSSDLLKSLAQRLGTESLHLERLLARYHGHLARL